MIKESLYKFKAAAPALACPVCGKRMKFHPAGRLYCKKEHSFDISSRGYVSFIPGQKDSALYTRGLFTHRAAVFDAGFYEPLVQALANRLEAFASRTQIPRDPARPLRILDAGCGEGYFAAALAARLPGAQVFGVDIVREAVRMAAGRDRARPLWLVADLTRAPLQTGSVDVVLNLLSPANYREFSRVLAPGGLLLKVAPAADYLQQARKALGHGPYEDGAVAQSFRAHFPEAEEERLRYTRPVDEEMAAHFLEMSPLAGPPLSGLGPSGSGAPAGEGEKEPAPAQPEEAGAKAGGAAFREITIDLTILAARTPDKRR